MLFIHAPKTGGMSVTQYLSDYLSNCHVTEKRHETLAEARVELAKRGRLLKDFSRIFVVMRNPYTLEISRFNYLRLGHPWDAGKAQVLALTGDFKHYLREAPFFGHFPPRLDLYYQDSGLVPANLSILRYERLAEEVAEQVAPFCLTSPGALLPRVNATDKSVFEDYYDSEAEELCFQRHNWFFEKGFYDRKNGTDVGDFRPVHRGPTR